MAEQPIAVCLALTQAISRTPTVEAIYAAALDALRAGLGVSRASVLLFDADGVMRFKAWRGLSDGYRAAVEGHTPWTPDTAEALPLTVEDVRTDASLTPYLPTIQAEGIAAMGFIPLVSGGRVIGKFMLYYDAPHVFEEGELQLAGVIAAQVAFAVHRTRAEAAAREGEARLRFALDAASMGTWEWNLETQRVRWSDNLERIHGLPPGTFDGTFASYEREIHPDDRERVLASVRRAIEEDVPHDLEYRIVAPDGTVRWAEGKGHVDRVDGRPVRMTGVCMIVTRRKEAEVARLESAREANRLKDEFLATLSHELRTPLNAILGWLRMIESGATPPENLPQAIQIIDRNARLQARLIEDILDVSRIVSGKLEIERAPVALGDLIAGAARAIEPLARARRLHVRVDLPPVVPTVAGDAKRLEQVLNNLLSNAVKFSPEEGTIVVTCRTTGHAVRIEVTDSGVGIAPEFLPHVFDRFRQADSRAVRQFGGLGLGLAIVRHLVERHGGSIEAESAGPGLGATFRIVLPAGADAAQMPAAVAAAADVAAGLASLAGASVLIVDDHHDSRELLREILLSLGAQVHESGGADEALEILAREQVDLLIADIAMPGVDGYALIRSLRASKLTFPAVALTAYITPEDRARAREAGYDLFLTKPIDPDTLRRSVCGLLAAPPHAI